MGSTLLIRSDFAMAQSRPMSVDSAQALLDRIDAAKLKARDAILAVMNDYKTVVDATVQELPAGKGAWHPDKNEAELDDFLNERVWFVQEALDVAVIGGGE